MSLETWCLLGVIVITIGVFVGFVFAVANDAKARDAEYDTMLDEYFSELRRTPPRHVHRVQKIKLYDQDEDGAA